MKQIFLIIILLFMDIANMQGQQKFESLESLLTYADSKSIALKTSDISVLQAKKTLLASKLALLDPIVNITGSFTDNTRLPVNIIPAELFGGKSGEFRQIQFGVQYNTNSVQTLDIKLLNLEGLENFKLAKINIQINENDAKLNRKNLHDNIAAAYYNIVQLNAQLQSTAENLLVADSLLALANRKYNQGIVKQQDVNDSRVNQLTIKENIRQIEFLVVQNYITLKTLSDIPEAENIEITEKISGLFPIQKPEIAQNGLLIESNRLKEYSALTYIQKTKRAFTPTVSFVASNAFNLNNNNFSILSGTWITSNYLGLKLNLILPNANTLGNKYKANFDWQMAQKNTEKAKIKTHLTILQLENDWVKAISQTKNNAEIVEIHKDTYIKNRNLYTEGLISIDRVLNSFNAMINANYSLNASKVGIAQAQEKIDINNKTK